MLSSNLPCDEHVLACKKIHELHFDSCSCIQPYMIYITVYFPQMMSNSSCFLPTSWLAPCSLHLFATEVPCPQVIGFAKKALADSSGTASGVTSCPVVRRLAKVKHNKKGEEQVRPLFKEHSLSLPIELTLLDGELLGGYPRLKLIDFFIQLHGKHWEFEPASRQ